jgi:hypothetical protein
MKPEPIVSVCVCARVCIEAIVCLYVCVRVRVRVCVCVYREIENIRA